MKPLPTIDTRKVKLHRVWTRRHYRPLIVGALCAAIYGWGLRWAEMELGITMPDWIVAITAQGMWFLGAVCARLMWFDL
jgi:type IV secretory pathway TrbD component